MTFEKLKQQSMPACKQTNIFTLESLLRDSVVCLLHLLWKMICLLHILWKMIREFIFEKLSWDRLSGHLTNNDFFFIWLIMTCKQIYICICVYFSIDNIFTLYLRWKMTGNWLLENWSYSQYRLANRYIYICVCVFLNRQYI